MRFCNQACEWNTHAEGCTKPLDAVCPLSNMNVDRDTNVLTNADHIRSMTDEELAVCLRILAKSDVCLNPQNADCDGCVFHPFCNSIRCEEDVMDWLKQPWKEEA